MFLRILAMGGVRPYLRDPWNVFDGFMVLIGWTQLIPTNGTNTAAIRALRALRALRPLRTITKFESLKFVLETLFSVRLSLSVLCITCASGQERTALFEPIKLTIKHDLCPKFKYRPSP